MRLSPCPPRCLHRLVQGANLCQLVWDGICCPQMLGYGGGGRGRGVLCTELPLLLAAWLPACLPARRFYIDPVRECYEAFVVFNFFM